MWIPLSIRKSQKWQNLKFASLPRDYTRGDWVSDGSFFRVENIGGWAVVNEKMRLVASSPIMGRITSQRAECKGLLAARVMGPLKTIHADPKPIIETLNKATKDLIRPFQWAKINNRSIIRNIIHLSNGESKFVWVKGHQDGVMDDFGRGNIAADFQAKRAARSQQLAILQESWEFADAFFYTYKGKLYEGDVRKRTLTTITKANSKAFCADTKNARFKHDKWWMLRPSKEALCKYAHIRFKLFTRSLPTFTRLAKRFAHLYDDKMCPSCEDSKETDIHVFTFCPAYSKLKSDLWLEVKTYFKRRLKIKMRTVRGAVNDWINKQLGDCDERAWWFLGGIPSEVEEWLANYVQISEKTDIWNDIHLMIMKTVSEIWRQRCNTNKQKRGLLKDLMDDAYEDNMIAMGVEIMVEEEYELEEDWLTTPN